MSAQEKAQSTLGKAKPQHHYVCIRICLGRLHPWRSRDLACTPLILGKETAIQLGLKRCVKKVVKRLELAILATFAKNYNQHHP